MKTTIRQIREALSHPSQETAHFIVSDGLHEYDINLSISDRKTFYDADGTAEEKFVLYIENPQPATTDEFVKWQQVYNYLVDNGLDATSINLLYTSLQAKKPIINIIGGA